MECPSNGRYSDTGVFCLNEDGTSNCQIDSDCSTAQRETDSCPTVCEEVLNRQECHADCGYYCGDDGLCRSGAQQIEHFGVSKCDILCLRGYETLWEVPSLIVGWKRIADPSCRGYWTGKCGLNATYREQCSTIAGSRPTKASAASAQSYSGQNGLGVISPRCPATTPCPYPDGKCGRLVGFGSGGRVPACPRRRYN